MNHRLMLGLTPGLAVACLQVAACSSDGTTPVCVQPDAADCIQPASGGIVSPTPDAQTTDSDNADSVNADDTSDAGSIEDAADETIVEASHDAKKHGDS